MRKIETIILPSLFILIIGIVVLRNIPFEYDYITTTKDYTNQPATTTVIPVPRFSFDYNDINNSVKMKSLRSNWILNSEVNKILSKYDLITCDGKEYYYYESTNNTSSFTILEYKVDNHYIYSTIQYKYLIGNYCEIKELGDKVSYREYYYLETTKNEKRYTMTLLIGTANDIHRAELNVFVHDEKNNSTTYIEKSSGTYSIIDNKLIYERMVRTGDDGARIPNISTFIIKDKNTITLDENYFPNIFNKIVLQNNTTK